MVRTDQGLSSENLSTCSQKEMNFSVILNPIIRSDGHFRINYCGLEESSGRTGKEGRTF